MHVPPAAHPPLFPVSISLLDTPHQHAPLIAKPNNDETTASLTTPSFALSATECAFHRRINLPELASRRSSLRYRPDCSSSGLLGLGAAKACPRAWSHRKACPGVIAAHAGGLRISARGPCASVRSCWKLTRVYCCRAWAPCIQSLRPRTAAASLRPLIDLRGGRRDATRGMRSLPVHNEM